MFILERHSAILNYCTRQFGVKDTGFKAFVRAHLLATINNGLIIMSLDGSEQMMISGGLFMLAVAFGCRQSKT